MRYPHTLKKLRSLASRTERTLTNPKVSLKLPTKTYRELVSIGGIGECPSEPDGSLPALTRAELVLRMVREKLHAAELEAKAEWGGS